MESIESKLLLRINLTLNSSPRMKLRTREFKSQIDTDYILSFFISCLHAYVYLDGSMHTGVSTVRNERA